MKKETNKTAKKTATRAKSGGAKSSTAVKKAKSARKKRATRAEALKSELQASLKSAQAKIQSSVADAMPALRELIAGAKKSLKAAQKKMGTRKTMSIIGLAVLLIGGLLAGRSAMAQSNANSLNTLGNQSQIMQKARPSIPANTYRVVQKRVIERDFRSELGISVGTVAGGGDSYYETSNLGLQYDFHLNTRFSLGLRYHMNFNRLTPEGKRVYDRAEQMAQAGNNGYVVPDLDQPLSTALATVSFYPVYGKVSWFESTVSYFDFYVMAGGGTTQLKNGSSPVATAGLGMGMWWNQYLTSRFEARYQTYEDQIFTGKRRIEGAVATFTMGLLL